MLLSPFHRYKSQDIRSSVEAEPGFPMLTSGTVIGVSRRLRSINDEVGVVAGRRGLNVADGM